MNNADIHRDTFLEEARDLMGNLEHDLLELENDPENENLIHSIFQALHTIKGSGGMFGFTEVSEFTHQFETLYDQIRSGIVPISQPIIDLSLKSLDVLKKILFSSLDKEEEELKKQILSQMTGYLKTKHPDTRIPVMASPAESRSSDHEFTRSYTYRIHFEPFPQFFLSGNNPIYIINELRQMGYMTLLIFNDRIPTLGEIDPESCYTYWNIFLTTNKSTDEIKDVFIFVEDLCRYQIDLVSTPEQTREIPRKIGEILIERGEIKSEDIKQVTDEQQQFGKIAVSKGLTTPAKIAAVLKEQKHLKDIKEKRDQHEVATTIRVASEKVDRLVDLVGELVTFQARFNQFVIHKNETDLRALAKTAERLISELRDNMMNIRMMPIGTSFGKLNRLVRDLSKDLGKEVEFRIEGAETELDKSVIEQLNDPLVHIVRNSIDHGIELPQERQAKGKPAKGTITCSAFHAGAYVIIRIEDDGAGLNKASILAKAREKGLISGDVSLSDREIFNMIFMPGFSTAQVVTNVSGRGVGMDVVKRNIENLRGSIDISSQLNTGTIITLKLPLTLAIIDGLLVKISDGYFVFPLSSIERCLEIESAMRLENNGRNIVMNNNEFIPFICLRDQFEITDTPPEIEQIVITEIDSHRIGFVVDRVMGEYQTVIKPLGSIFRQIDCISGATILGDGTVALILDINHLYRLSEKALSSM